MNAAFLKCSFCGKDQSQVLKLITGSGDGSGSGGAICTECVALCVEIHDSEGISLASPHVSSTVAAPAHAPEPTIPRLGAPWRGDYIADATNAEREVDSPDPHTVDGCVFCTILTGIVKGKSTPTEKYIVHFGAKAFVILNAYPYTSGHLMVMPNRHIGALHELTDDEHNEVWSLLRSASVAVQRAYEPDGMNVGINLGRAAGAGVPGHLHVHVVPRWNGDTNFMTAIGETRVVPESLERTWQRITAAWPH